MTKAMNVKVLHVVKTTSEWLMENTIISKGLLCIETTTDNYTKAKVGDGIKKFSDLPYLSDGSFNINDYYNKAQTDAKISEAISTIGNILTIKGVKAALEDLPTTGNKVGDLWFIGIADDTTDSYLEYVWTTSAKWEFLGRIQKDVDLSEYAKITYVDGKITLLTTRVTALESSTHTHSNKTVLDATTASYTTSEKTKLSGIADGATKTIVDTIISATSTNPVQNKVVSVALDNKVDKVSGKGLSTNDYTTAEKTKLASLVNFDDTGLSARVTTIENDYVKSTDTLILNCTV